MGIYFLSPLNISLMNSNVSLLDFFEFGSLTSYSALIFIFIQELD